MNVAQVGQCALGTRNTVRASVDGAALFEVGMVTSSYGMQDEAAVRVVMDRKGASTAMMGPTHCADVDRVHDDGHVLYPKRRFCSRTNRARHYQKNGRCAE